MSYTPPPSTQIQTACTWPSFELRSGHELPWMMSSSTVAGAAAPSRHNPNGHWHHSKVDPTWSTATMLVPCPLVRRSYLSVALPDRSSAGVNSRPTQSPAEAVASTRSEQAPAVAYSVVRSNVMGRLFTDRHPSVSSSKEASGIAPAGSGFTVTEMSATLEVRPASSLIV